MSPIFVICPPRSRADLLLRMMGIASHSMADEAVAKIRQDGGSLESGIIRLSFLGRESQRSAEDWWTWLLAKWPGARLIFLKRDQGEIELSMLATRHLWMPKWGQCTGCCGRQVKAMHMAMEAMHARFPERTDIIESADLLTAASASVAFKWVGLDVSAEAAKREIATITHPYKAALTTDPDSDPFHPFATSKSTAGLPGSEQPEEFDPFASDVTAADCDVLPGTRESPIFAIPKPKEENPRRLDLPKKDRGIPAGQLAVYTLRYGDADWISPCASSMDSWIARHGYELRVWAEPIAGLPDEKFSTVAMLRNFLESDSEWMLYVDADVLIHPIAPRWPMHRGIAAAHDKPMSMRHWGQWLRRFYPHLPVEGWAYRNSGVWSMDRESASAFLREVDATPEWHHGVREQHQWNVWLIFAMMRGVKAPLLGDEWNLLAKYDKDRPAWFFHLAGKSEMKSSYIERLYQQHLLPRPPEPIEYHEPQSERAICYPWLPALADWDELRYSLRSVAGHFADTDCPIYILGDTPPPWLDTSGRVKFIKLEGYAKDRQTGMREARALGYQIAEKVLWMNDDIYLLRDQSWEDFEVALTEGAIHEKRHLEHRNQWMRWMGKSAADLKHNGAGEVLRFATHTPMLYEATKAREVYAKFHVAYKGTFANLYHNFHGTPHRPIGGDKAKTLPASQDARFLNHPGGLPSKEIRDALESMFPDPAPWESDRGIKPTEKPERMCVATHGENLDWLDKVDIPKCVYDTTGTREELIQVPNDGREASQYLRHIIENYGDFADYELFVQGHPFDHSIDILDILERKPWRGHRIRSLAPMMRASPQFHAPAARKLGKEIGVDLPESIRWTYGAMFAVSREALMSRPREWWQMVLDKIIADKSSPWSMEILWFAILS